MPQVHIFSATGCSETLADLWTLSQCCPCSNLCPPHLYRQPLLCTVVDIQCTVLQVLRAVSKLSLYSAEDSLYSFKGSLHSTEGSLYLVVVPHDGDAAVGAQVCHELELQLRSVLELVHQYVGPPLLALLQNWEPKTQAATGGKTAGEEKGHL